MTALEAAARRKTQLSAIHACKAQLKLDDETYRAIVARVSVLHGTACTSSADMDARQRQALLDELRSKGAPPGPNAGKPSNSNQLPQQMAKVQAQLASMKLSWAYADAIAKRMFGIAKCGWLRKEAQWVALIAALHNESIKRELSPEIDRMLAQYQLTESDIPEGYRVRNWRRSISAIQEVHGWLLGMAGGR